MTNKLIIKKSDDSESLYNLLKEALSNEQKLIENSIARIKNELAVFEKKYSMTTEQFIECYSRGEEPDSLDFVDWSGLYHILQSLLKKQSQLHNLHIFH